MTLSMSLFPTIISLILVLFTFNLSGGSVFDNIIDDPFFDSSNDNYNYETDNSDSIDQYYNNDDSSVEIKNPTVPKMVVKKYEANWTSLDSRPTPSWYDSAKIGIFIHWGVFSVPAYGGAWFWNSWIRAKSPNLVKYMADNYPPSFTYQDFAPQFKAEFYNATEWVELFKAAGARYVVLTSKHHEGYTNWPSKYSFGWNSMDVGPKRDLLGELADAVKKVGNNTFKFGLYHSLFEFFNPLYLNDKANGFKTQDFVNFKTMPELYELVNTYEPQIIWSDGDWEADDTYWNSKEFLAWLYNDSPVKDTVLVNDRWGAGDSCKHGDFYNCQDHYNPHKLQPHKWENAFTIDKSAWATRINARIQDYHTIDELIEEVVTTVACGGNVLLNVGPTKEGIIIPIMQERLLQLGAWLKINGDGIYETSPWKIAQFDSVSKYVWYTAKPNQYSLYAFVLKDAWTTIVENHGLLDLGSVQIKNPNVVSKISILGYPHLTLTWNIDSVTKGLRIHLPKLEDFKTPITSSYGWTIQIEFNKETSTTIKKRYF